MKFSTILFIVIIMALTIICVRFLESYLNKKRRTTTVSLTPIIFLVLSIVLIIVYLNFEPESFERVEKQGLLTLSYSFVSENQMSIKDKIHNCIIIFILTNIPAVISIYNRIKRNRTITRANSASSDHRFRQQRISVSGRNGTLFHFIGSRILIKCYSFFVVIIFRLRKDAFLCRTTTLLLVLFRCV